MKYAKTKRGKFKVSEGHKKGSPKLDMGGKDRSESVLEMVISDLNLKNKQ